MSKDEIVMNSWKKALQVLPVIVLVYSLLMLPLPESAAAEEEWQFRFFGVSVGEDRNRLLSGGPGTDSPVSLSSALFNEDGTVSKKGGKFVADAPADGGSYYYTVIDPTTTNFRLQADVTVNELNPAPDGQEGFALMARDSFGEEGVSGSWMSNLVSVCATKLPCGGMNKSPNVPCTIGLRAYRGIVSPEASDLNEIEPFRYSWGGGTDESRIEQGKTYRVCLEKTDNAYIASQSDPETGEEIGRSVWYIPARDSMAAAVTAYSELDDPLSCQEEHAAYIALVVARGLNATFSNIQFTTSEWNAAGWTPQETEYTDLEAAVTSPATASGDVYQLVFRTNADGTARVLRDGTAVTGTLRIRADEYYEMPVELTGNETELAVEFTPDPAFTFSAFRRLSSYDPCVFTQTVTRRALGKDGVIRVSKNGKAENGGTSPEDAVDLQTALDYAAPGQTVLLSAGVYDLSDRTLTVARGRDGSEEKPIAVKPAENAFVTLDFGGTGSGMVVAGDYWHFSRINITGTKDRQPGFSLAGHHCVLERMNFYGNGGTGLQISGSSRDKRDLWPSHNLVRSCASMNNADKALENADGFAAKLTSGEGNTFDSCIAAWNADDGWDLFAKISTGPIGSVTIRNCVAFRNGLVRVVPGGNAKGFERAAAVCDEQGNLSFAESEEMEAGNGNGFKLGGSNLPGGHILLHSIAYENRNKGIDSNGCPDVKIYNCTSYGNGSGNVYLYCGNRDTVTDFEARGILSFRTKAEEETPPDRLDLQGQAADSVTGKDCFYWDPEKKASLNSEGEAVQEDWFVSLDTSVVPEWNPDGSILLHGLLTLTDEARSHGSGAFPLQDSP